VIPTKTSKLINLSLLELNHKSMVTTTSKASFAI